MTSIVSTPLPSLSTEVHNHILGFCDASTLFATSLVSLSFLELSSPILYQHITLNGAEQIEMLFCTRKKKTSHAHLERYLSLAQVKSFTLINTEKPHKWTSLSKDRLPSSRPLAVDELHLRAGGKTDFPLQLFNPSIVVFTGIEHKHQVPEVVLNVKPQTWSRLERITFHHCSLAKPTLSVLCGGVDRIQIVFEDTGSLPLYEEDCYVYESFMVEEVRFKGKEDLLGRAAVKEVVLVTSDQFSVDSLENGMFGFDELKADAAGLEKRKQKFRSEVVKR